MGLVVAVGVLRSLQLGTGGGSRRQSGRVASKLGAGASQASCRISTGVSSNLVGARNRADCFTCS